MDERLFNGCGDTREAATVAACEKAEAAMVEAGGKLRQWRITGGREINGKWMITVGYKWTVRKARA